MEESKGVFRYVRTNREAGGGVSGDIAPDAAGRLEAQAGRGIEPTSYDPPAFASVLAADPNALLILDSSFISDTTPDALWPAVLSAPGRVVLLPEVMHESRGWLNRRPDHPLSRAIATGHPALRPVETPGDATVEGAGLEYYRRLLALRRRGMTLAEIEFERKNGRPPTPADTETVRGIAHRSFGERGYQFVKNKKGGASEWRGPTADEAIVVGAAGLALIEQRQTLILTRDRHLHDQLFKLDWLMQTHYRGMLMVDAHLSNLKRFARAEWPEDEAVLNEVFAARGTLLRRTEDDIESLLPDQLVLWPVTCFFISEATLSAVSVRLEGGMARLLRAKGETGGLNTNRLDGLNCHIWLAPIPRSERLRDCAVIGQERETLDMGDDLAASAVDFWQTLLSVEQIKSLREV